MDLDGFQEMLWHFASHRVVTVAARTGVLGLLAERPATPEEVAAARGLDELATGKVLRALAALGVLRAEGPRYRVTEAIAPLFRPGDGDLTPFVEHLHWMYESWGQTLEPWLRGTQDELSKRSPPPAEKFAAAMRAMGSHVAAVAAARLDLRGARRMLDVGGSYGHYARAFCEANPSLRATVLDREAVATIARDALAGTPLAERIDFLAGDYLETPYGSGYDLVLQANVLHQETPERAAELVARGAAALAPGGRLVVLDWCIDDAQRGHVMGALFAINMRSFGDTYTELTIRDWMVRAGLEEVERTDISRIRWLIVGRRPGSSS